MSDNILSRNIKKFDGTNFQAWKFRMNTIYIAYGLHDVITGERVMPEDDKSTAGKKMGERQRQSNVSCVVFD